MDYNKLSKEELVEMLKLQDEPVVVDSPVRVCDYLKPYESKRQEHLIALYVDAKMHVEMAKVISIGGVSSSIAEPRSIFSTAVDKQYFGVILAHNHPSGDTKPSLEDIEKTKRIWKAGEILGIPLVDHIVFSKKGYDSIQETKEWKEFLKEQDEIAVKEHEAFFKKLEEEQNIEIAKRKEEEKEFIAARSVAKN